MSPRTRLPAAVLLALLASAPASAQPETMATRVREAVARLRASAVHGDRPTQLNVTVGIEGVPRVKAVLCQDDGAPERHLQATIARVYANPRDPAGGRETTAAFYVDDLGSDPIGSESLPHLAVDFDLEGVPLRVTGLAPGVPGASVAAFGQVASGLPEVLASRDYVLSVEGERVLAALQETLRGELFREGQRCDAAAALYSPFPGTYVAELQPRCVPFLGDQGTLTFEIDGVTFDVAGTPKSATVKRIAGALGAGISGGALFVPRLRPDQVWSDASPGLLRYGATESGAKALDFAKLHSNAGESLPCSPSALTLCLDGAPGDQRFEVTMSWHTASGGGRSGIAFATPLNSLGIASGGLFSFFENNPEVLIKVLDACAISDRFWLFGAPTTTVGFEIKVVDTVARMDPELGPADWEYVITNADGDTAEAFNDTSAFATCDLP